MKKFSKYGFTLIELLAVIIILAVIALIATPIVLNVVDNAKEASEISSITGYADAAKLSIIEYQFANNGIMPIIDTNFIENNIKTQGNKIICEEVLYSKQYGVVLHGCEVVKEMATRARSIVLTNKYYFALGKVYTDKDSEEYKKIYASIKNMGDVEPPIEGVSLISTVMKQYNDSNTIGLLKDGENYYYKGTNTEVSNNFVWFEGHLWRVIQVDSDNTVTMITQQPITAIQLNNNTWSDEATYQSSYINDWLNNVFYGSFSNKEKIQKTIFNIGSRNSETSVTTNQYVGLLDIKQYSRAGLEKSFLNIYDEFAVSTSFYYVTSTGLINNLSNKYITGARPVIKISDLSSISGTGTLTDPFREKSATTNTSNIKVGEYISLPTSSTECGSDNRCLFRVVSKDENSVKIILNGFLSKEGRYGSSIVFSSSTEFYPVLEKFVNSIPQEYRFLDTKSFNIGEYIDNVSYKTVSSKKYNGNFGLPVIGEMFSGNDIDISYIKKNFVNIDTIENPYVSDYQWCMNPYKTSGNAGRNIFNTGNVGYLNTSGNYNGIRPTMFLNQGLTFTKGDGTAENPYWLGN